MAKKKAKSAAPSTPRKAAPNPFDLAALVSDRVRIEDVRIRSCGADISSESNVDDVSFQFINKFSVEFDVDQAGSRLHVRPHFRLEGVTMTEPSVDLSISCLFVLTYGVESFDGLDEANFEAFANLNGVYNAWPYWREYVQNVVARMGLPRLVVPVFRFG